MPINNGVALFVFVVWIYLDAEKVIAKLELPDGYAQVFACAHKQILLFTHINCRDRGLQNKIKKILF
jgi:hypothetical protein